MKRKSQIMAMPAKPKSIDDVLAMRAGRELDLLVAYAMKDRYDAKKNTWYQADPECNISCADGGPYHYSTQIESAWRVHKNMMGRIFSKRQRYLEMIRLVANERRGVDSRGMVDWAGALMLLVDAMPEAICKAMLIVTLNLKSELEAL